ncbi:MAG TPA: hypothetical protein VIY29_11570 [Ktedonobacteraceae bacterium]
MPIFSGLRISLHLFLLKDRPFVHSRGDPLWSPCPRVDAVRVWTLSVCGRLPPRVIARLADVALSEQ